MCAQLAECREMLIMLVMLNPIWDSLGNVELDLTLLTLLIFPLPGVLTNVDTVKSVLTRKRLHRKC